MDLGRPILKESIIDMLFNSAVAIVDKAGNAALNFANGVADGAIGVAGAAFDKVTSVSLGSSHSMSPEPAAAQVRAPEIAPARGAHDVDVAELGSFAPPALPMQATRSAGMSV